MGGRRMEWEPGIALQYPSLPPLYPTLPILALATLNHHTIVPIIRILEYCMVGCGGCGVVEQVMDNEMMGVLGHTAKGTKDAVKKLKDLPTRSWGLLDFRMQKNVWRMLR